MALAATIFKTNVEIADIDRSHYAQYALTLARHPSETNERMMVRLLAFMRHASDTLIFGKGVSDTSEPDLWQKDRSGTIELWIEVGQPDPKRIIQACNRAEHVFIYAYGKSADQWWQKTEKKLDQVKNFSLLVLPVAITQTLSELAERNMQLQCSIQEKQMYMVAGNKSVHIDLGQVERQ